MAIMKDMEIMSDQLTGIQIRLARALTGMSVSDLNECSGISMSTIKRIELVDGVRKESGIATLEKITNCLEKAMAEKGWQFTDKSLSPVEAG